MKHKWIIVLLSVVFFLGAVTFYVNRVIFPTVIKKIAIDQAQHFLKRKVEIESVHFNWLRGVVVHKIKVYQKDSPDDILAQAEKVSLGIIFIPGFKHHQLTIPFIRIQSPSFHLIHQTNLPDRQAGSQWNFSDIISPSPANEKPSPIEVKVGGVTLTDGKLRLDDLTPAGIGTQLIDQINCKVGLSYQGIGFDASLAIPQKQGLISLQGAYQPLSRSLTAKVHIKNIKPVDYLGLTSIQLPFTLASATINEINAQIDSVAQKINVQGDWSIQNIDLTIAQHNIKTDLDVKNASIHFDNGTLAIKGEFDLSNTKILTPTFSTTGTLKANISDFLMNSPDDISIRGSLQTDLLKLKLSDDRFSQGQISVQMTRGRWQKDSASLKGDININQLFIALSDQQNIKGDLKLAGIQVSRAKTQITAHGNLDLTGLDVRLPGELFKADLKLPNFNISMDKQNNVKFIGPLVFDHMDATVGKNNLKGALHLSNLKANFDQQQQMLDVTTQGVWQDANITLEKQMMVSGNARFDIHAAYPLKNPGALAYGGSVAVEDGRCDGLALGPVKNINLSADVKTNTADIQNLSLVVLDTPLKASGQVTNFLKPALNVEVESERFDLSKLKNVAPDLLKTYGLTVDGETSFKLQFDGMALDPLSAKINAEAVLKNINVQSSALKQNFTNISGSLRVENNALSWKNFTVTALGRSLTSTGHLTDFKNPKVTASISSQGIDVKLQANKDGNMITINDVSGYYLSAVIHTTGSVDLSGKIPQLDIKNDLKFKLEDLENFVPDLKKAIAPWKLSGLVGLTASMKGPVADWKNWTSTATAQSDLITLAGLQFNNVNMQLAQGEGKLNKFNITSTFYDGTLNIITSADLTDPAYPFETAVHVENANLAKLKNDAGAKDEDLRGLMAFTLVANGTAKDILKIKGKGALNIAEGYLMKKEFSSLFLIPELNNLIFTDATANFTLADQKVSTDNFLLRSQGADLNGKGWVDFDQTLNFEITPQFNPELINASNSFKKGPSALIASAVSGYLTIYVEGTLEKPRIRTIKKPAEIIKKTGEIIQQNVGQILQGIFQ